MRKMKCMALLVHRPLLPVCSIFWSKEKGMGVEVVNYLVSKPFILDHVTFYL